MPHKVALCLKEMFIFQILLRLFEDKSVDKKFYLPEVLHASILLAYISVYY